MSGAPDATGSAPDGARSGRDEPDGPRTGSARKSRLAALERRLNQRTTSPRARRWLLIGSLAGFVAIAVLSYLALPDDHEFNWWMAPVLVLVCTPLTVLANAAEFKVMATFSGHRFGWVGSARLTLIATAANLLPLPGGIMIRTQALRAEGATYRRALGANAAAGGAWVGVGALATGALILGYRGSPVVGFGGLLVGAAAMAVVIYLMRRVHRHDYLAMLLKLTMVEVLTVLIAAVRVLVSFAFLRASINPAQAVALTTPAILAAAIGIFPAGLGLRELLAGAVAVVVNVPVAQSVAATAVDRVFSQLGLAVLAGLLLLVGGRAAFTSLPAPEAEIPAGAGTVDGADGAVLVDGTAVQPLLTGPDGEAGVEVPHHGL